ncbi:MULTISPECIES: hypothetical protein [Kribbella]|uniref:hypothetical protein n=1 Tax=Kribbella TaxID=182639 RepID=UPI00130517E0|nr:MULTISPECIES: hypothetical protein [Kribbella]
MLTSHHRRCARIVVVALVLNLELSRDRSGERGCYAVRALPDDMGVDAQRDSWVGMAKSFRYDVHRDTRTDGKTLGLADAQARSELCAKAGWL